MKKKKFLALMICFVMIVSLIPVGVVAFKDYPMTMAIDSNCNGMGTLRTASGDEASSYTWEVNPGFRVIAEGNKLRIFYLVGNYAEDDLSTPYQSSLTAVPNEGYEFVKWTYKGEPVKSSASVSVPSEGTELVYNENPTVYAVFREIQAPSYTGSLTANKSNVETDETVTLTASVTPGNEDSTIFAEQFVINYDKDKYAFTSSSLDSSDYTNYADQGKVVVLKTENSLYSSTNELDIGTFTFTAKAQDTNAVSTNFSLTGMKISPDNDSSIDGEDAITATLPSPDVSVTLNYNDNLAGKLTVPASDNLNITYDGSSHTAPAVTTSDDNVIITYGSDGSTYNSETTTASGTNANTYTQYYKATLKGYQDVTSSYDLVIGKKDVTLSWSNTDNQTFTGNEISGPTATVSGLIGSDDTTSNYSIAGNSATNVGSYTATLTFTSGDWQNNYSLPSNLTQNWKIVKDSAKVNPTTITDVADWIYDGSKHALVTMLDTGVVGTNTITYTIGGTDYTAIPEMKDAGTYTISYKIENGNYADKTGSVDVVVSPKEVGLTWGADTSFTYNGSEQNPTATATGLCAGDSCTVNVTGGETDAGTGYTATASSLSNNNYKLPSTGTTKGFSIGAKSVAVSWSDTSKTYNGHEQNPTAVATGVSGETINLNLSAGLTNVGSTTVTASIGAVTGGQAKAANYTLTNTTQTFTVTAKSVTLTWGNCEGLVYNGSAQTPTATSSDFISGHTPTISISLSAKANSSLTESNAVNAGSYTATASLTGTDNGNYSISNATNDFDIAKKTVTITPTNASKKFGETDPTLTGNVTGYLGSDETSANISYTREDGQSVGQYYIDANYTTLNNYAVTANRGTFTINALVADTDYLVDTHTDYVSGSTLVLVFTNNAGIGFKYDGDTMDALSGFNYAASDGESYTNVFAYVVTGSADTSNVTVELKSNLAIDTVTRSANVNGSTSTDVNDVATVNGVYNNKEGFSMETILRANYAQDSGTSEDVNKVNATDQNAVRTEVIKTM